MIVDIPAATVAGRGIAVGALVMVVNVATGTVTRLRVATRTQVMIIDIAATAAVLLGIAIGALVMIIDIAARTAFQLRVTRRTQIVIIDIAAAAAAFPGIAIGTLVMIINVAATGKGVTAKHQYHRKNHFHFILPEPARKQPGTG
jgi:hypothetical protein